MNGEPHGAMDAQRMRQANLALVLGVVLEQAPVSQSSLVDLTGLKKPTISKLVEELHRAGWIRQRGESQGALGRPRQLWGPVPERGLSVSAQISVDGMAVLIADFAGEVRARRSVAVDVAGWSEEQAVRAVAQMIRGSLSDVFHADGQKRDVLGTALAVPGIVTERGEWRYAPGLAWDPANIGATLRQALGSVITPESPVLVENEATLATVAEHHRGAHAGVRNMVYVLAEWGVGAGVVLDGELFRGAHRYGGEIGHVTMDLDGPLCPCGKRGCWAMFVGEKALAAHAMEARRTGRPSQMWGRGRPADATTLSSTDVLAAARDGDTVAVECVTRLRRYVAAGIGNLVSMYDPEVVVLGGFLRIAFADSLDALRTEVDWWLMGGQACHDLRIELAGLGADAARWGGVTLVLRAVTAAPRVSTPASV